MSADNFCRSRKLSSALREESKGKEWGRKDKGGGILTDGAHPCRWFLQESNVKLQIASTIRKTIYNHQYEYGNLPLAKFTAISTGLFTELLII